MFDTEIAYIAGLFDGEGCIGVYRRDHEIRSKVYPTHYLQVSLANTNRAIIDWLKSMFTGTSFIKDVRGVRPCWSFQITQNKAASFLKIILPYLRIKKAEAELAIEFSNTVNKRNTRGVAPEVFQRREEIMQELHELKRRVIA